MHRWRKASSCLPTIEYYWSFEKEILLDDRKGMNLENVVFSILCHWGKNDKYHIIYLHEAFKAGEVTDTGMENGESC